MLRRNDDSDVNTWLMYACILLLDRLPNIDLDGAEDIARELYRAWPRLEPEDAVKLYFQPLTVDKLAASSR